MGRHFAMNRVAINVVQCRRSAPGALAADRGVVMFMVLWVLVLLTIIVGEFCFGMRTEVNITRNIKEKTETYYIALAGIHTAIDAIVRGGGLSPRTGSGGTSGADEKATWCVNSDIPTVPYAQGSFTVWIDNESGKIDLNTVEGPTIVALLEDAELDDLQRETIADSILDWRDRDNLYRTNGAEDDYYQGLSDSYPCKNSDFDSVAELLLVKGVTLEIFNAHLAPLFTVYEPDESVSSKTDPTAVQDTAMIRSKINLNAASISTLMALPGMTEDLVALINEYRKEKDFLGTSEVISCLGVDAYQRIAPYIQLKNTNGYMIHSVGRIEGSQTEYYLKALMVLDPMSKKKYRVVKWWDQPVS